MTVYRLEAHWDSQEPGTSSARWELRWDPELVSFRAVELMNWEPGEIPDELRMPEDDEPLFSCGDRPGQLVEIDQLEDAMSPEIGLLHLPRDIASKLEADRDNWYRSLTPEESRTLVERLAAG